MVTKTAFRGSQTVRHPRAGADDPGRHAGPRCAPRAGVTLAVGDITDTAQVIGTDGKPVGTGPYFGVGFDAQHAGRRAADAVPPARRRAGPTGPGEVVIDRATAESQDYAVGDTIRVAARGEAQTFTRHRHRQLRRA